MPGTAIADTRGWAPAADDTAEALGLKGQGRDTGGGRTQVPGDLNLNVTRAVVTNRVTSDAYAAEVVAHTRMLEGLRSGTHQHQKIVAAHSEHRIRASADELLAA